MECICGHCHRTLHSQRLTDVFLQPRGDLAFVSRFMALADVESTVNEKMNFSSIEEVQGSPNVESLEESLAPREMHRHRRTRQLDPVRIQGIINNIRGFQVTRVDRVKVMVVLVAPHACDTQGELLAAHTAPDVVGIGKRFTLAHGVKIEDSEIKAGTSVEVVSGCFIIDS